MLPRFINDVDKPVKCVDAAGKVKWEKDYERWYSLRGRYDTCEEWRTRSSFEAWLTTQLERFPEGMIPKGGDSISLPCGYHLNQAILGGGTDVCSPDTYVLIPDYVWAPLRQQKGAATNLPAGVRNNTQGEGYYSRMYKDKSVVSHYFKDPMKAHQHWQAMKYEHLKEVAARYLDSPNYDLRVMKILLDLMEKIAQDIWDEKETKQPLLENLRGTTPT